MKWYVHLLLIPILLIIQSSAHAGAIADAAPDNKRFIGILMDEYATIAGGWYLEKKCHFLSDQALKEFESDIASTTVGMHQVLGVSQWLLYKMQEGGKNTANDDRWKCDTEGREIVATTVDKAKKLKMTLTEIQKLKAKDAGQEH